MWLSDFRIVLPDGVLEKGALLIEDGVIARIEEGPVSHAAMPGGGLLLLPGFVDMHGDMIEREVEPRPNVKMPMELGLRDLDRRLATAGVTTGYAAVSFNPKSLHGHMRSYDHTKAMLRALAGLRDELSVDHKIHARFEVTFPDALKVIEELIAEGNVDLLSLTDHTPGQGQYRDIEKRVRTMMQVEDLSAEGARSRIDDRIAASAARAGNVETNLRAIAKLCAAHNVVLASHDDDTVAKVALMHDLGAAISEFPVTLEAAAAARARGMATAMGAPNALRGLSYSGNLSARDAHRAGLLDILAADYHPSAILPAILALAANDPGGVAGTARLATLNPARALGLVDRGAIAVGKRADLVIADPRGVGHVKTVFSAGRVAFSDGVPARFAAE